MKNESLLPHLFRTEFRKISTVLCKHFGIEHIETAEDIASETFLSALESWPHKGVPENPKAWLYAVAKNKAKNIKIRQKNFEENISKEVLKETDNNTEIDLSEKNIFDSQLQMLFAICHPTIPKESQISLALRILCGFGIDEIASAFLTNKETVNKRLTRAKDKLRKEHISIEFPPEKDIKIRLNSVLLTLYLLFNEGYYSEIQEITLREELSFEAIRLTEMLLSNSTTNLPETNALYALMCFHASRFGARKNQNGETVLYHDQDESLWDQALIQNGVFHLHNASNGDSASKFHIEASIAYWMTIKNDTKEKWEQVLKLYNLLLFTEYSPIAALNRTFALSKVHGKQIAIKEAEKLNLSNNPFYFSLLGELYAETNKNLAIENYKKAITLTKNQTEKYLLMGKIKGLNQLPFAKK
jgi:RNA polymerase sigma factor (sigma-70 family)